MLGNAIHGVASLYPIDIAFILFGSMAALLLQPDALTLLNRIIHVALVELSETTVVYADIGTDGAERVALLGNDEVVVVKLTDRMLSGGA